MRGDLVTVIDKWASAIPSTKPSLQAPKSTSSRVKTKVPSLTSGSSGCSYAPSVLSDNVKIVSHHSDAVKVKFEHVPALSLYNNGGLSDNDELKREEREVAIKSPPKGKKRITVKTRTDGAAELYRKDGMMDGIKTGWNRKGMTERKLRRVEDLASKIGRAHV